jgi:hypothetical protein
MFTAAIRYRKVPDTVAPIQPVTWCKLEPLWRTGPSSERIPRLIRKASANTIVEWPSENQKPTVSGRLPSEISLRVVLSIAAMWSASKAWRMPSV